MVSFPFPFFPFSLFPHGKESGRVGEGGGGWGDSREENLDLERTVQGKNFACDREMGFPRILPLFSVLQVREGVLPNCMRFLFWL